MGEAVALRFAQAGASVIIVGRSEEAAKRIIDECKLSQRPGAAYHFVKADLTLVAGVKEAVRSINKHAPNGIDYLVETQGGPPITKHALTSEGHEAHFALQNLSRFGIPYLLLREGKLKESLTIIAAAGQGGKTMDLDDIELQKDGQFTILKRASRDSNLVDGFVQEFARQYPKIGFNHILRRFFCLMKNAEGEHSFPAWSRLSSAFFPSASTESTIPSSCRLYPIRSAGAKSTGAMAPSTSQRIPPLAYRKAKPGSTAVRSNRCRRRVSRKIRRIARRFSRSWRR